MTSQQTPAQQAETLEQLGEKRFTLAEWEATAKRVGNNINANLMKRVAEQAELITQLRAAVSGEGNTCATCAWWTDDLISWSGWLPERDHTHRHDE